MKYIVFSAIMSDISCQSAKETSQGKRHQCQFSPPANKEQGTVCYQSFKNSWRHMPPVDSGYSPLETEASEDANS